MSDDAMKFFRLFRDVCRAIHSSLDVKEVLNLITKNTVTILNTKACTIFLLNKVDKTLEISSSFGLSKTFLEKGPVDAEKSIIETIEGKVVQVYDAKNDPRIQYPEEMKSEGISSILSVPMPVKSKVIGVLRIYTSQPRNFSENEVEFVSGLSEIGGIAIENAQMYQHLKSDHETLINEIHQRFDYGRMP